MIDILRVCLTVASTAGIAEPSFAFVPYCATWPTLNTLELRNSSVEEVGDGKAFIYGFV